MAPMARTGSPTSRKPRHCEDPRTAALRAFRGDDAISPGAQRRPRLRRSAHNDSMQGMDELAAQTDSYFLKTKAIVGHFGDRTAVYAVFMRRPVICAPRFAIEFLEQMAAERGQKFDIEISHPEGAWVGAGDPILHVGGSLHGLVDLETLLLQKLGPACVA